MLDEKTAIALSAYADGELDARQARTLEERLAGNDELRRALAAIRKLDAEAARLPVPELAEANAAAAWKRVGERTTALSAADRRAWERLEKAARELPVPAVSELIYEQVWAAVQERLAVDRAVGASEQQALGAPAPAISEERWAGVWKGVVKRAHVANATPAVSPVFAAAETRPAAEAVRTERRTRVLRPVLRWQWLAPVALAASVLLAVLLWPARDQGGALPGNGTQTAMNIPEVLDDRYRVQVEYVEGQEAPVVCFFLKEDAGTDEPKTQNWRWLPE
jgi:hypothetical protein